MTDFTTAANEAEATDAATAEKRRSNRRGALTRCECSRWEIGLPLSGDDDQDVEITTTGCISQTNRMFSQGHDAKLKSLLIRAGVEGFEVRYGRAEGVIHTTDPETAADKFGFGHQVRTAILARLDKMAKGGKRIPPAARAVAAEVAEGSEEGDLQDPEFGPLEISAEPIAIEEQNATIKIGRWTYEGVTINPETGEATFTKNGEVRTAEQGKYTII